ncbi:hypothetical protein FXO38_13956 [Capsicum annuum]|uniref:Uncharacterized protein n=1 Tax=Capsicum annuum TaxID=4072 RepID=A0A2G2Z5P7_CAPAN|nr:hypothetical protein FXO38_13956 [Capsicum annuum]PHT77299.1 hypothetical protein T459_20821 [Capsicum annuum]
MDFLFLLNASLVIYPYQSLVLAMEREETSNNSTTQMVTTMSWPLVSLQQRSFSVNTATEFQVTSLIYFLLYCILGVITVGIAVSSVLFIPIILMGSGFGRLLGIAMRPYTKIDQGLYAVLGAASLMAGSMRMTVTVCIIE